MRGRKPYVNPDSPILKARQACDWSQGKLAEKIGCSTPTLVHIEHEPQSATLQQLQKIYDVLPEAGRAVLAQNKNFYPF